MIDWDKLSEQINSAGASASEWSRDWLGDLPLPLLPALSQPSARTYAECKEQSGESGWDENGAWRCLFPGARKPNTFYTDYKQFLEARHAQFKREQERQRERQREREQQAQKSYELVSEADAKNKTVTGRSVNIECTDENGKQVSRKRIVTYYSDNTASVETKENSGWFWKDE